MIFSQTEHSCEIYSQTKKQKICSTQDGFSESPLSHQE